MQILEDRTYFSPHNHTSLILGFLKLEHHTNRSGLLNLHSELLLHIASISSYLATNDLTTPTPLFSTSAECVES